METNKYQEFLTQKLQADLNKLIKQRENLTSKLNDYENLEQFLITTEKKKEIKTEIEVGKGIYMKAKIDPSQKFMMEVGLGFFLEITSEEAKKLIPKQKKLLENKIEINAQEIAKVRMNIAKFETTLNQLMRSQMN